MNLVNTGASIVENTMAHVLPARFDGLPARVMLVAIGLHESGFSTRKQIGGPARGFWQFEQGGGVRGVLNHPATRSYARSICGLRGCAPIENDVYAALLVDDLVGCAFARLLLFSDPAPLPKVGAIQEAWEYYLRTWRPGAYARGSDAEREALRRNWTGHYIAAQAAVVP